MVKRDVTARRIVTGVDKDGKSRIDVDTLTPNRVITEAFTINQIWQAENLPPTVLADDSSDGGVSITPPGNGFVYLVSTFHPDNSYDLSTYAQSLAASGGEGAEQESEIPGLHETDSVDIVTVISGELYAVMETGEVVLKPGDTIVQRGTKHSWSVRGDEPATAVAVMMTARR